MIEPAIDEEEAQPRFLLCTGTEPVQADAVAAVLVALQPTALIVRGGSDWEGTEVAHAYGVALLAEDDVDRSLEADGIHLTDPARVSEVRAVFDRKRQDRLILGADVGLSRHDAMVAGEAGADYVAFGERDRSTDETVIDLVQWWRDLSVFPCLAYAADTDAAAKLARIGTDFIGVSAAIWDHPDGPKIAASELRTVLEKALSEKT